MVLFRSCSVQQEAELLKYSSSSSIFLSWCWFLFFVAIRLWRNSGGIILIPANSIPIVPVHPVLIWCWLGQAWVWAWMLIAMGCETDSQSRLERLSPSWSSLQEGTKGPLQGSAGWISSEEPMAWAAGCLFGRRPAVAPAVGHCKGRSHAGVHTESAPPPTP